MLPKNIMSSNLFKSNCNFNVCKTKDEIGSFSGRLSILLVRRNPLITMGIRGRFKNGSGNPPDTCKARTAARYTFNVEAWQVWLIFPIKRSKVNSDAGHGDPFSCTKLFCSQKLTNCFCAEEYVLLVLVDKALVSKPCQQLSKAETQADVATSLVSLMRLYPHRGQL